MARAYTHQEVVYQGASVAIGAGETATQVSDQFHLSPDDSLAFEADIVITGSNFTGATVNLWHSLDGSTFSEVAKTAVSMSGGAGTYTLKFLPQVSGDQSSMPLRPYCYIAVDSGAGADYDVDSVIITRRK